MAAGPSTSKSMGPNRQFTHRSLDLYREIGIAPTIPASHAWEVAHCWHFSGTSHKGGLLELAGPVPPVIFVCVLFADFAGLVRILPG